MNLLLIVTLIAQACGGACSQTLDKPVLSVTGQGVVVSGAKASDYTIILYADTYDETEINARNKADIMKKEITKIAMGLGAKDEDVVLTNLNTLEPIEDDPYYRIEQDIQIFLKDVDNIDKTKEKFLSIAGTSIGSATPVVSESADYSPAVREARAKAVTNAKTEARDLANAVGVILGEPVYISEEIVYPTFTGYETFEEANVTVYVTMIYEIIYRE